MERALEHAERALNLYRDVRSVNWEVSYRAALDVFRSLGDRFEKANMLTSLAESQSALGRHDEARTSWQQVLALYRVQQRAELAAVTEGRLRKTPDPGSAADG